MTRGYSHWTYLKCTESKSLNYLKIIEALKFRRTEFTKQWWGWGGLIWIPKYVSMQLFIHFPSHPRASWIPKISISKNSKITSKFQVFPILGNLVKSSNGLEEHVFKESSCIIIIWSFLLLSIVSLIILSWIRSKLRNIRRQRVWGTDLKSRVRENNK